jgi:DNA-binding transcriptional ArsR family regulator
MSAYVILLSHMSDDLEPVWRALASPIRRRMLDLLRGGPVSTGALTAEFHDLSRFAVMQHLAVLEEADLVVPRREGRTRLNFLNPVPIQRIYHRWVSRYQEPWAESLVALKGTLESDSPARPRRSKRAG